MEISIEKMSTHNTKKQAFLLSDMKHECSLTYEQSFQHNSNNTKLH